MIHPGARVRLLRQITFGPGGRMSRKRWISAGAEGEVVALNRSGRYWLVRFSGERAGYCRPEELALIDPPVEEDAI